VCSGRHSKTDEAMPIGDEELRLVNGRALRARQDIIRQGIDKGFTEQDIVKAIKDYNRRGH